MAGQCGKFCIRLGKTVLEMHETLRTACIVTAMGRTHHRLIVWNMPVKFHGRLQCVVDLHEEVGASVAH